MKKMSIVLAAALMVGSAMLCSFTMPETNSATISSTTEVKSGIVFRHNQYLKERNGSRQLYLYTSGKCEMWDGDRLEVTCRYDYRAETKELLIQDNDGRTLYKGSVTISKKNGQDIANVTIAGTTYYKK